MPSTPTPAPPTTSPTSRCTRACARRSSTSGKRGCTPPTKGGPTTPSSSPSRETVRALDIPKPLLLDLLSAFRQDTVKTRYETWDELLDYCRRSANPVGRLVLLIFDYRDPELALLSDRICTALQLANHWQDLAVDLARGRIYAPRELRDLHGVKEWDLNAGPRRARVHRPDAGPDRAARARCSSPAVRCATAWAATSASRCG